MSSPVPDWIGSLSDHWFDLAGRAAGSQTRRCLFGITGVGGAGKSTLAESVRLRLMAKGLVASVLPMDGFHLSNAELDRRDLKAVKGSYPTFDVDSFLATVSALAAVPRRAVSVPVYCRQQHEPIADARLVDVDCSVVIVEGNYLLLDRGRWSALRDGLDEVVYLSVPLDLAMQRILDRHMRGGCSPAEAQAKLDRTDRPNARLIQGTMGRADRVIAPWD